MPIFFSSSETEEFLGNDTTTQGVGAALAGGCETAGFAAAGEVAAGFRVTLVAMGLF